MTTDPTVPHISPSVASTVISRSALHAWQEHWLLGGLRPEPSEQMERGIILESYIFNDGLDRIVAVEADDWRTKAAKEARAEARAANKVPVLIGKLDELHLTASAISKRLAEAGVAFIGKTQVKLSWDSNGCPCKGKLDHWISEQGLILDLKCVADASPEHVQRAFTTYGYDIQSAAYVEGVEANHPELAGRVKMLFLFAEVEPPHAVAIYEPDGMMRELGGRKWERAKAIWKQCLATNVWPAYGSGIQTVSALPWQLDRELSINTIEKESA